MVKIEKLKKSDISKFHRLLISIFDEGFDYYPKHAQRYNKNHWTEALINRYFSNDDFLFLIAREDEKLVGYLIGKHFTPYRSTILWLGVIKLYQGRKIGSKLVEHWENWSKKKGARLLKFSTANFANEGFYRKLGYKKDFKIVKNDWGMKKLVFRKNI